MALIKQQITGQIEVGATGTLGIRSDTIVLDDGVEISRNFHRKVLSPGDDVTGEDAKIQAVAAAVWTSEVVAAFGASQAAAEPAAE